jgi:exonuclease III
MRIATYNILRGGSQRVHWVKMIEDHSVDLLLLQESYAHDEHLPPLRFPDARTQSVWQPVEHGRWGSVVFSRTGALARVTVPGFSGWVVGAKICRASWQSGLCDSILAFSVHVPSRGESYCKQVNRMLDELLPLARRKQVIIGGDFNIAVSNWPGSERPASKRDLAIHSRLADEFGLINCWQEANPNQPLQQTLRWTGDRTIPYHCDGLFVPKGWKNRLQSCVVLAGDEWSRLSDHNPVVAEFR